MSLRSWWEGRHERRRQQKVVDDLARWYLERSDTGEDVGQAYADARREAYTDARRDLRLQELGVPELASELEAGGAMPSEGSPSADGACRRTRNEGETMINGFHAEVRQIENGRDD